MAGTSGMSVVLMGDTAGVSRMLTWLQMKLSNHGMMAFLAGAVYPYIKERAEQRFTSEGDDASGQWAPLRDATQHWRQSQGFSPQHPINVRTGELYRYITQSTAAIMPTPKGTIMRYPGKQARAHLREKVKTAQKGKAKPSTVARPVLVLGVRD